MLFHLQHQLVAIQKFDLKMSWCLKNVFLSFFKIKASSNKKHEIFIWVKKTLKKWEREIFGISSTKAKDRVRQEWSPFAKILSRFATLAHSHSLSFRYTNAHPCSLTRTSHLFMNTNAYSHTHTHFTFVHEHKRTLTHTRTLHLSTNTNAHSHTHAHQQSNFI